MRNTIRKSALLIASILVGYLICINFNLDGIETSSQLNTKDYQNLQEKKNNLVKQVSSLKENNDAIQIKIEKYSTDDKKSGKVLLDMSTQLMDYGMVSGLNETRGKGIEIVINDGENSSFDSEYEAKLKILHDFDMENIINAMKVSGAEAISINGHRISASTAVRCHQAFLEFEDGPLEPAPFIISAIGNPESLKTSLFQEGSYLSKLKIRGLSVEEELKDDIIMKAATVKKVNFATQYTNKK